MSFPARAAGDASAVLAVGRSNAFLERRQEEVRDSQWASDRDFQSAMAVPEPRVLPERLLWLARRVQRLRDAWRKAACRMVLQVSEVLRVVQVLLQKALRALPQERADESESLQVWRLQVQQASRLEPPPQVQKPTPWVPLEQRPLALRARWSLPQARREPPAHSVSQRRVRRSLAEAPRVRQASSARPSQPLPWILFPLWQPLLLALPLQPLPESFCAPSRRRPRGSSSSASSFP
jgi:hypothetical protein